MKEIEISYVKILSTQLLCFYMFLLNKLQVTMFWNVYLM